MAHIRPLALLAVTLLAAAPLSAQIRPGRSSDQSSVLSRGRGGDSDSDSDSDSEDSDRRRRQQRDRADRQGRNWCVDANQDGRCDYSATGRYPDSRYPDARYPDSRYPDGRYPDGRYPGDRYPTGRNSGDRYPDGRTRDGRYPRRPGSSACVDRNRDRRCDDRVTTPLPGRRRGLQYLAGIRLDR